MPSAKKIQSLYQQGDLSQSDQQQLAKSIADMKKKRAQKRIARVATLPFEIHVHSWYYYQKNGYQKQSKEDLENMHHVPRTVPHTFVQRPRLTRITTSTISVTHYYKYHIDAVIRCPDFASSKIVAKLFSTYAYYPFFYPQLGPSLFDVADSHMRLSENQVYLNFSDEIAKIPNNKDSILRREVEGYNTPTTYDHDVFLQNHLKIWKHFNPNETSRIWVTYKDEIIFDNNDSQKVNMTDGFLNIVGKFMETSSTRGFRTTASGQFIS